MSFRIGYVTDVEGNLDYFNKYVSISNVLAYNDSAKRQLVLKDDCYFVHGGDIVDKGPGDIRLCRLLVDLKRRYPTRVFLLVGNRDLNKLRFSAELAKDDIERQLNEIPGPHWDPHAPTILDYLTKIAKESNLDDVSKVNTPVNRLKYMLECTLGCPQTFNFRKEELSVLNNTPFDNVTDEDVLRSFIYEIVDENGSLYQYILNGNVAVRIGNTLFVHGCVDENNMKYIPQHIRFENSKQPQPPGKIVDNVDEWIYELNNYLVQGLNDFRQRPKWDDSRTTRGGESLMALQNRSASWGRTVIVNCYGDGGNISSAPALEYLKNKDRLERSKVDPLQFEGVSSDPRNKYVADWLLKYNIQRVVVGHKPCGDSPAVCNASYTGVEICCSDTSFSYFGDRSSFTIDNIGKPPRGLAVSSTEIAGKDATDNYLLLRGILQDGKQYECQFNRLYGGKYIDTSVGDSILGQELKNQFWVKASYIDNLTSEKIYHCSKGVKRNVKYKRFTRSQIEQSML